MATADGRDATPGGGPREDFVIEVLPVGPLQCNCVILGDRRSGEAIVVDPGDDADRILQRVRELEFTVKSILHTHTHVDHVSASDEVRRGTGGETAIHRDDAFLLDQLDRQAAWIGIEAPPVPAIDRELDEGDLLRFGPRELSVLHTPGHTPGSLTFVCQHRDGPIVLSGDTLFAGSIGRTDLPGGDTNLIIRSIRHKLYELPEEARVVPGHGPPTTIRQERLTNEFVRA